MNKYTKEELISAKFDCLTMGDLTEFVYNNPQIPRDTKILVERVTDNYFDGFGFGGKEVEGWKVLPVKGEHYYNEKRLNDDMAQEIKDRKNGKEKQYPKIENPEDYIVELTDDLKEQFFPAWCITKDNEEDFIYIYNHY